MMSASAGRGRAAHSPQVGQRDSEGLSAAAAQTLRGPSCLYRAPAAEGLDLTVDLVPTLSVISAGLHRECTELNWPVQEKTYALARTSTDTQSSARGSAESTSQERCCLLLGQPPRSSFRRDRNSLRIDEVFDLL